MQPIAKRTRHQRENDLMRRYWEMKKRRISSAPANDNAAAPPPSSGPSIRSSSASVSASAQAPARSPVIREDRNEGTSRDHGAESEVFESSESERIDLSSDSEFVGEEMEEVSSGSESEEETRSGSVDSGCSKGVSVDSGSKIESFGDRDRPIVLGDDVLDDDDDDDQRCQGKNIVVIDVDDDDEEEEEEADGSHSQSNGFVGDVEIEDCIEKEESVVGMNDDDDDDDDDDGKEESVVGLGRDDDVNDDAVNEEPFSPPRENEEPDVDSKEELESEKVEVESLYKLMDSCLEGGGSDAADAILVDGELLLDGKKSPKKLCKEGKHVLSMDEEIGFICKSCGLVKEEIKHVTAPFKKKKHIKVEKEESGVGRLVQERCKDKVLHQPNRKVERKGPLTDNEIHRVVKEEGSGIGRSASVKDRCKEKVLLQQPYRIVERKGPLTVNEIHRVLYNSIMDVNVDLVEEAVSPIPQENEETSPSPDDVDSDEEVDSEKPKEETEVDSLYKLMDFCLVGGETGAAADAFLEDEELLSDAKKSQKQLCKEGKHYLIVDEEIGVLCKACGLVREEIKYVTAPFHETLFGFRDRMDYPLYGNRDAGDLPHVEDLNSEDQLYKEDANFDPSGTVWEIIPGLRRTLLPHQREAFEFLWTNVAGGTNLDELMSNGPSDGGGGCLISHAPGTGKTRLSIAFLETYMKLYKNSRPVILAPASILLTWKKEFEKWNVGIPFQNLIDEDLSKDEIVMARSLLGIPNPKNLNMTAKRLIKLLFWKKHESVLAISYSLFTSLASEESAKKQGGSKKWESEKFRQMLIDLPGLLILDEGHMPRNDRSRIFKVLSEVKTKKRFILSGTPFQNNYRELQNILSLVRPEFSKRWEKNPFKWSVEKANDDKIKELKEMMEPFYHCHDGSIVDDLVPGLNDNLVFLEPSVQQCELLNKAKEMKNHLEANACTALISVHPRLFRCKDENKNPDFAEELKCGKWDLADGAKASFLMRFIELSSALGERVLVFSEYLQPLNFVKALLESSGFFGWREGREILFMSGQQEMETRKRNMELFNKAGSEAKVMLASIRAASEGIELIGASRVVLLDVTWNPAVERQAISRAYRLGQERVVHVYHLLMTDHDSNRHTSQTHKNKCSEYVFSSSSRKNGGSGSSKGAFEDIILDRLLEEKVVKEAVQRQVCEPGS